MRVSNTPAMTESTALTAIRYGNWHLTLGLFDLIDWDPKAAARIVWPNHYDGDPSDFLPIFKSIYLRAMELFPESGLNPNACLLAAKQTAPADAGTISRAPDPQQYLQGAIGGSALVLDDKMAMYVFRPHFVSRLSAAGQMFLAAHEIGHHLRNDHLGSTSESRANRRMEWNTDFTALPLIGDISVWHEGITEVMGIFEARHQQKRLQHAESTTGGKPERKLTHPPAAARIRVARKILAGA